MWDGVQECRGCCLLLMNCLQAVRHSAGEFLDWTTSLAAGRWSGTALCEGHNNFIRGMLEQAYKFRSVRSRQETPVNQTYNFVRKLKQTDEAHCMVALQTDASRNFLPAALPAVLCLTHGHQRPCAGDVGYVLTLFVFLILGGPDLERIPVFPNNRFNSVDASNLTSAPSPLADDDHIFIWCVGIRPHLDW